MLTQQERTGRIEKIRSLPAMLEEAVRGLNDAQLDTPYRDGGWTVRQVVHHLADSHMNAYTRMKLTLTEEHPTIRPYDQNAWAELPDAKSSAIDYSMTIVKALHARWAGMLTSVSTDAWARPAYHPENGEVSLEGFLITYSDHGENHVKQITDLRKKKGW